MSFVVLTTEERASLAETFLRLPEKGRRNRWASEEAMNALRCLKAVHSNAIEDKKIDRVFLQVLLHSAGIREKSKISPYYAGAASELRGQVSMLKSLEQMAREKEDMSISMILGMHRSNFLRTAIRRLQACSEAGMFEYRGCDIGRRLFLRSRFCCSNSSIGSTRTSWAFPRSIQIRFSKF